MQTENHTPSLQERFERYLGAVEMQYAQITTAELKQAGFHPQEIARLVEQGQLESAQRGVYAITSLGGLAFSHLGRVLELQLRFPKAVLCLVSAASYHRLTSQEPFEVHLALHRETSGRKPRAVGAAFHWMTTTVYEYGQVKDATYDTPVLVYSPAKTVADLCRRRHKLGSDLYLEALKTYLKRGGEGEQQGPTGPLLEAARVCGVETTIRRDLAVLHG